MRPRWRWPSSGSLGASWETPAWVAAFSVAANGDISPASLTGASQANRSWVTISTKGKRESLVFCALGAMNETQTVKQDTYVIVWKIFKTKLGGGMGRKSNFQKSVVRERLLNPCFLFSTNRFHYLSSVLCRSINLHLHL